MMCQPIGSALAEIIEDNERARIVRYSLAPGEATGWHTHTLDYVIVPYGDCRIRVESDDGSSIEAEMHQRSPYFREKGARHNVINIMTVALSFLEIEIKELPAGSPPVA